MSDYGLSVKKGDFELALNSNDPHWIAKEITLWREAFLSGQLAQALAVHPVTQPADTGRPIHGVSIPTAQVTEPLKDQDNHGGDADSDDEFDTVLTALMEDMAEDFKQPEPVALTEAELTPQAPEADEALEQPLPVDAIAELDISEDAALTDHEALADVSAAQALNSQADEAIEALTATTTAEDAPESKAPGRFKPLAVALPPQTDDPLDAEDRTLAAVSAELDTATNTEAVTEEPPTFAQWCQMVPPLSPIQSLLWASYYLTEYEHQSPFSLKALNALLAKADLACVNHSTLQDGLDDGLLQLLQETGDLTTTTQYHLTLEGAQETIRARQAKVAAPRKKAVKK
jgi:hypothetical protein